MESSPRRDGVAASPAWYSVPGDTRLWDHPSLCKAFEYVRAQSFRCFAAPQQDPHQAELMK